jgi:hypothetical protein
LKALVVFDVWCMMYDRNNNLGRDVEIGPCCIFSNYEGRLRSFEFHVYFMLEHKQLTDI